MRKFYPHSFLRFAFSALSGIIAVQSMTSCKDDPKPTPAVVNFTQAAQVTFESDGTLRSFHPDLVEGAEGKMLPVKISLDRAVSEDIIVRLSVSGTASRNAQQEGVPDYSFTNDASASQVLIPKGSTEATINILVWEDYVLDYNKDYLDNTGYPYETIIVKLESVNSSLAILDGSANAILEHTITIKEDDTVVWLEWDNTGASGASRDMDIFVYIDGDLGGIANSSVQSNRNYESINIPAGFPDELFGLSYVYKSGDNSTLDFFVQIDNFGGALQRVDGNISRIMEFSASYQMSNINNYNPNSPSSIIVQRMSKKKLDYFNLSSIEVPGFGSRVSTHTLDGLISNSDKFNTTFPEPLILPRNLVYK